MKTKSIVAVIFGVIVLAGGWYLNGSTVEIPGVPPGGYAKQTTITAVYNSAGTLVDSTANTVTYTGKKE